eukprot:m.37517 g.37517  ORF g.37517 m.37517 type:complete len:272 (-) comp9321_c0_seq1:182-997(-)
MRRQRRPQSEFGLSKQERKDMATDTLSVLQDDADTQTAQANTVTYSGDMLQGREVIRRYDDENRIEIWRGTTTLAACARLQQELGADGEVCALNFASAKNPGGGFLRGSSAQEESICRASGLYHCIQNSNMYTVNRRDNNYCIYANMGIFSPRVPVIKSDTGVTHPERQYVSFITVPAVNAKMATPRAGQEAVQEAMRQRIRLVLQIARHHNQRNLVLGAFGCGVFGNSPNFVAQCFRHLLNNEFRGVFSRVIFGMLSDNEADAFSSLQST